MVLPILALQAKPPKTYRFTFVIEGSLSLQGLEGDPGERKIYYGPEANIGRVDGKYYGFS